LGFNSDLRGWVRDNMRSGLSDGNRVDMARWTSFLKELFGKWCFNSCGCRRGERGSSGGSHSCQTNRDDLRLGFT
jgi:hypothetical protein